MRTHVSMRSLIIFKVIFSCVFPVFYFAVYIYMPNAFLCLERNREKNICNNVEKWKRKKKVKEGKCVYVEKNEMNMAWYGMVWLCIGCGDWAKCFSCHMTYVCAVFRQIE